MIGIERAENRDLGYPPPFIGDAAEDDVRQILETVSIKKGISNYAGISAFPPLCRGNIKRRNPEQKGQHILNRKVFKSPLCAPVV